MSTIFTASAFENALIISTSAYQKPGGTRRIPIVVKMGLSIDILFPSI
jgi:hypothetical protein